MKKRAFVLLLTATMLMSACSSSSVPSDITTISETTSVITTEITTDPTPTPEPTPTPVVYDFTWTSQDSDVFANYFENEFGKNLRGYIMGYGFTDEVNEMLTNYINYIFNTDYKSVPFSEVDYFHTYMVDTISSKHTYRNSYDKFATVCLDYNRVFKGPFANKLIMSYLYQNGIPMGARIPLDNLLMLGLDDMYNFGVFDYIIEEAGQDLGNFDSSYQYSNYDLYAVLVRYNYSMWDLCNDERIKNLDLLTDDPEFAETAAEAVNIYNGYLKDYYGAKAPQIGQVITKEQYVAAFGEEPLDLSYIPGAIFDPSLVPTDSGSTFNAADSGSKTDERLIGEWTSPENYSGYTGTYIFNEDNTGTYIYTAMTKDLETGERSEKLANLQGRIGGTQVG